jgi:glycosyltransferase involved in cell wall biosynthesis
MPHVTIVIPAYNAEQWLSAALGSALAQTYADIEVVVVDDGSTDGSARVVESFADPRVRLIRQENRGLSAARNTGIRQARGSLVAFLDADDLFDPNKIEKQVRPLENEPELGVVSCGFRVIDEVGSVLGMEMPWRDSPIVELPSLLFSCPLLPSTLLCRRDWLVRVGMFNESQRCYEDWEFAIRLALAGCRFGWVREPLISYRRHASNLSTSQKVVPAATRVALAFMKRFFSTPGLPGKLQQLRPKVFGNLYLDAAARAYGSGMGVLARRYLRAAIRCRPDLASGDPPQWVVSLCGHALTALVRDAGQFVRFVGRTLPAEVAFNRWGPYRLTTHLHVAQAFMAHRNGHAARARMRAIQAILRDPRVLSNRGLISLALRP